MKANRKENFKTGKNENKYMWQYLVLVAVFIILFVPLVNTQYFQVCITQQGTIQNILSQTIKVPLISTISAQNQTTTFYLIQIENLPKYVYTYGSVGCNNLYWYYAPNGTYTATVNVATYLQTNWVSTDNRMTQLQVMP